MTKPVADGLARRLAALVPLCSLGEVGLSDSDEDELRRWAQIVSTREPRVQSTSFGLVFLALSTVVARKNAKEHRLWPFVWKTFREEARSAFFDQNQQPRAEVREAVEAATSTHGLRHVFDRNEGEQRWYLTVLLQCGWSAPSLVNLPEWLAGRCLPRAMELLLDDPVLRSRSFADAFESLRALRLGRRANVPETPWLPRTLAAIAHESALARAELGTAESTEDRSPARVALCELGSGLLTFRIDLPSPEDVLHVASAARHLDFAIGQHRTRVNRQADGSYSKPAPIELALTEIAGSGVVTLQLMSATGETLVHEPVELFGGDEDVDLFVGTAEGVFRRVADPWTDIVPRRRPAILRVADDLEIDGRFTAASIPVHPSLWQRVLPEEMDTARVRIADGLAWDFLPTTRARAHWPREIRLEQARTEAWVRGEDVSWSCDVGSATATVVSARLGRRDLRVHPKGRGTFLLVLPAPRYLPASDRVLISIAEGRHRYFGTAVAQPPFCRHLMVRLAEGVAPLAIEEWGTLAQPVRFFNRPGEDHEQDVPWLFEASQAVAPVSARDERLQPRLTGIGGKLTIRSRRFNTGEILAHLSPGLENRGDVLRLSLRSGEATLELRTSVEWADDDFALEALDPQGAVRHVNGSEVILDGQSILFDSKERPAAVAVLFRGATVGRLSTDALATAIRSAAVRDERGAIDCLRWIYKHRLAVDAPENARAVEELIGRWPLQAIALALDPLFEEGVLQGTLRERLAACGSAIRTALGAEGDESGVGHFLLDLAPSFFEPTDPWPRLAQVHDRLVRRDPVTACCVLQAALIHPNCFGNKRALKAGRSAIEEWAQSPPPRLEALAGALGVDDGFLRRNVERLVAAAAAGEEASPTDRMNLRNLLFVSEFRLVAALEATKRILQVTDVNARC